MKGNKTASPLRIFQRTFFGRGFIVYASVVIIAIFVFCAVFAPVLTSYEPNKNSLIDTLQKPSAQHLLGCDLYGRDVFTRLLYGARVSLLASFLSCAIGAIIGMTLGLIAGYFEGPAGTVIMRYVDLQLAIPPLLFTIIIGMLAGHSLMGLVAAISFGMVPGFVRLMYGQVLSLKGNDYITALRFANIGSLRIILRHLLPNTFPSMIVMFTMNLGGAIMLESTLSFLGIGIQVPTASWGNMVSDGYSYIFNRPLMAFVPGICITLIVIAFNIAGDSLRDALDPRLKGKL